MGEKDRLFFSWTQKDRLATGRKVGIDLEGLGVLFPYLGDRITISVLAQKERLATARCGYTK